MPTKLTKLEIERVDVVDVGANAGAEIVLVKRGPGNPRLLATPVAKRADQLGLTQEAVAKKAKLSLSYVAAIERGLVPSPAIMHEIAKALDASEEDLWPQLEWTEEDAQRRQRERTDPSHRLRGDT